MNELHGALRLAACALVCAAIGCGPMTTNRDGGPDRGDARAADGASLGDSAPSDDATDPDVAEPDVVPFDVAGRDVFLAWDIVPTTDVQIPRDVFAPRDIIFPWTDVPTDVPIIPGMCPVAEQRTITLPNDRLMGTLTTSTMTFPPPPPGIRGTTCSMSMGSGPEHVYRLRLTARTGIAIRDGSGFGSTPTFVYVSVRRTCNDATSELACEPRSFTPFFPGMRVVLDPGDYYVIVEADWGMSAYNVIVESFVPAPNATCATALALTPAAPLTAQNVLGGAGGVTNTTCGTQSSTPQLFYSVSIPAGQRAVVTATPTSTPTFYPEVRAWGDCTAMACLGRITATTAGAPMSLAVDNRTATARTVIFSVAGGSSGDRVFSVSVRFETPPTPVANATCSSATSVMEGAVLRAQDTQFATDIASCASYAAGRVLYYSATVPAGHTLFALATLAPTSTARQIVTRLLGTCGAATCLSSEASGSLESMTQWTNAGTAAQTVILAVGAQDSNPALFDLTIGVRPPPTNTTCSAATVVRDRDALIFQLGSRATESLTSACRATDVGNVLYYRATVPAGHRLVATVTPAANLYWDPVLRVIAACGATSCLADSNAGGSGAAESVTYTNAGAVAQDVVFAVGSPIAMGTSTFRLDVGIAPPPYLQTTIPTACDDMSAGRVLVGPSLDNSSSMIAALPFALRLVGDDTSFYSVSSNGFAQLYPSMTGTPSTNAFNVGIPATRDPNGFVAPFWDDLYPLSSGISHVVVDTFGAAPSRRFVIQWSDWTIRSTDVRVRFQAKLFETTNIVEFHYCAMTGTSTARHSGSDATVGLENGAGTTGYQVAWNVAGSTDPANAIRLTPSGT